MATQLELPDFDPFHLVCQGDCDRSVPDHALDYIVGGRSDEDVAQVMRNGQWATVYVGEDK